MTLVIFLYSENYTLKKPRYLRGFNFTVNVTFTVLQTFQPFQLRWL